MRTHDYLRKCKKGENVTKQKKYPGTPTYHSTSARKGRQAIPRVTPTKGKLPTLSLADIVRRERDRAMLTGFAAGFVVTALMFGLVMWLWVIPTMDAAVATAQGMVM